MATEFQKKMLHGEKQTFQNIKRISKPRGRPKIQTLDTRKCCICKEILSISKFMRSKNHPGGYNYVCRVCNTIQAHKKYIKNRLKKYGYGKILSEITELRKGIHLRWQILQEYLGNKK